MQAIAPVRMAVIEIKRKMSVGEPARELGPRALLVGMDRGVAAVENGMQVAKKAVELPRDPAIWVLHSCF